jgi:hypothetical protein
LHINKKIFISSIESDRSQFAADWDIKEMTMWKIIPYDNHQPSYVYFPFNTWLGRKMSTLKAKKEIYPSTDRHLKGHLIIEIMHSFSFVKDELKGALKCKNRKFGPLPLQTP